MIPVEISLRSPTQALHKTLPLHHHTISSSCTRLQRCIFSWKRMRVSTAYVQLHHPGKSWSEELSHSPCWAPGCPNSGTTSQGRHWKTKFETSHLSTDPSDGTAWHQGLGQHLQFPAPLLQDTFWECHLEASASSPSSWMINWGSSELQTCIKTGNSPRKRRSSLCPAVGVGERSCLFCQCPLGSTDTSWLQQTQPKPQTSPDDRRDFK